jgi:hypothetical protein
MGTNRTIHLSRFVSKVDRPTAAQSFSQLLTPPTHLLVVHPIYKDFYSNPVTVAFLFAEIDWSYFFRSILPPDIDGILVEVSGSCGARFSFMLNGLEATYLGTGQYNDKKYDRRKLVYDIAEETRYDGDNKTATSSHCDYKMTVYPTVAFEQTYYSNKPGVYCTLVVMVFVFTTLIFMAYDYMVYRRQAKLVFTAQRTSAMVSSLFPKEVHDRIMADAQAQTQRDEAGKRSFGFAPKAQLKEFLADGSHALSGDAIFKSKPIADLFPSVTIMFGDLVGFTAWSSMREPAHVFTLLETIYYEFDQIAKRRRVFKVETIGDCYVAVCGLPEPRKDNAVVMVSVQEY